MKGIKKKMALVALIIMMALISGTASATTTKTKNVIPDREKMEGDVSVATKDYTFDITKYGRTWHLEGYNQNADPLAIFNSVKENSIQFWYDAKVLNNLITDGEVVVTYNKDVVKKIADVMFEALDNISQPIGYQWQNGVKSTPAIASLRNDIADVTAKVDNLAKTVATNSNFINALWIEKHGFNSITVRIRINKISKKIEIFDLAGNKIEAYFIISDGNMGGLQTRRTTKLTTLSWNAKYGEFGILHCADVYAGTPIKTSPMVDVREIQLAVTHKHLTKTGVKRVLGSKAFNIAAKDIAEMLDNQ